MKKEKKKLSLKEKENIKFKRKKTIAKVLNIIIWIYAISVSLLLVVGGSCARSYSGASAETIEYDNDNILFDYSNYSSDVEYRFYWSNEKLKLLRKSSGVFSNNVIYRVPGNDWWYTTYSGGASLTISDISNITNYDKLHISNDLYLVGINAQCGTNNGTTIYRIFYYCYDTLTQLYSTQQFLRTDIGSSAQLIGVPVNIYGGYYDINYFNALVELMSGNYIIDTHSLTVNPGSWSDFGLLILGLFSQYSIQDINVHFTNEYKKLIPSNSYYLDDLSSADWYMESPRPFYYLNYSDLLFNYNDFESINNYVIKINNYTSDFKDYLLDSGVYYFNGVYYNKMYIKYYHLEQGETFYYTNFINVGNLPGSYDSTSYTALSDYEYVPLCIYLEYDKGSNSFPNRYENLILFKFSDFDYAYNDGLNVIYWTNISPYINIELSRVTYNLYFHTLGFNNQVSVYYNFFKDYISLDSSFEFVVKDNGVHINDGSINIYSPYTTTFDLIGIGFGGIVSLMSYSILPGISIGALLMVPVVLTLVLVIVKLFKR